MSNVDIVEAELWDHYSELPNPMWYQYKQENKDEEDDTDNSSDLGTTDKKFNKYLNE